MASKETLLNNLAILMGGRSAEQLVFNTTWSGSENDLKRVCSLANKMVLDWGMSGKLGHAAYNDEMMASFMDSGYASNRSFSEETAREIDLEIRQISNNAFDCATNLLIEHRHHLDRIAELLLEKDTITGQEILDVIS